MRMSPRPNAALLIMQCLHTPACWCARCVDAENDLASAPKPITQAATVPVVDVSTITEYGLTQKLSNAIRCF